MSNAALHDETTTNHAEVLTKDNWVLETFFGIRYDNILDILHELNIVEEIK